MEVLSAENLSDEVYSVNIREYGPDTPELGYGTSWLQEMPYLRDDLWGEHFRERGFNSYLREAWHNRHKDPTRWQAALHETFDKPLENTLKEYKKQGVGNDRKRFYAVQLDADYLREMFDEPDEAEEFFERFLGVIRKAREENMFVNIFINQYAGIKKGEEESARQEFEILNVRILEKLHENNLNGDDKEIFVQPIPERDKSFWLGYIDKIVELNGNAFRFSSEWSRVMYEDGSVNEEELDDLAEIIQYAKGKGVEVSLCLNHFTMPDWITDGWLDSEIATLFGNYSESVYNGLAERGSVPKRIFTINEAMSILPAGYMEGSWYPYEKLTIQNFVGQYNRASRAISNSRKAHIEAYKRIKESSKRTGKPVDVGFTHNMAWFSPYVKLSPMDIMWATIGRNLSESWLKDLVGKDALELGDIPCDTIGIQFYNEHTIGPFNGSAGSKTSIRDLLNDADRFINGWKRYPEGMLVQLLRVNSAVLETGTKLGLTKLPSIVISEFGVPGLVDPRQEIRILSEAINSGKELGYLEIKAAIIWTLLNNFELSEGYGASTFGHYDDHGNGKEPPGVAPKELNINDWNIKVAMMEFKAKLQRYTNRLRKDERIPTEYKNPAISMADVKLFAIEGFLSSLNKDDQLLSFIPWILRQFS